jgi:hypothetical protein
MTPKYTFAKESEYKEFMLRSNRGNKIREFFFSIITEMPIELKKEVRKNPTRLVETNRFENSIAGVKEYSFVTERCSEELTKYLENFAVFVEEKTVQLKNWRQKLKELKFLLKDYQYSK